MNMVARVDGAICRKPSKFFKGLCGRNADCEIACGKEKWPTGKCIVGFRCQCQRRC
ncbi:Defensin-like protein AX1 [Bienertia sinuspersici]